MFIVLLFLLVFSTLMFYAEQLGAWFDGVRWIREDGTESPYQSIPESFWWCIVTITTVGYGIAL